LTWGFNSLTRGIIVSGPLMQLRPTTAAPSSRRRFKASANFTPSNVTEPDLSTGARQTTAGISKKK